MSGQPATGNRCSLCRWPPDVPKRRKIAGNFAISSVFRGEASSKTSRRGKRVCCRDPCINISSGGFYQFGIVSGVIFLARSRSIASDIFRFRKIWCRLQTRWTAERVFDWNESFIRAERQDTTVELVIVKKYSLGIDRNSNRW